MKINGLVGFLFFSVLLTFSMASRLGDGEDQCVYTVYVRTGSMIKSGTDATIGLTVGDSNGGHVAIPDLRSWGGLMGPDHDYFERDGLDAFSGRGPCGLSAPLCRLDLTSDGSGDHPSWFCDYVEVTATGPHVPCTKTRFYVMQWLGIDVPPYQLYATVDGCDDINNGSSGIGSDMMKISKSHFVIRNGGISASE